MPYLSLLAAIISGAYLLQPGLCGPDCTTNWLNQAIALAGAVYFLILTVLLKCNHPLTRIFLTISLSTHFLLMIYGTITNPEFCSVCLLVLMMHILLFIKTISDNQNIMLSAGLIITIVTGSIFLAAIANETALLDARAELKQSGKQEQIIEASTNTYMIEDQLQGEIMVDVRKKPIVFWYPYCDHCHEVLELSSNQVQYCAVWLRNHKDLDKARELADKYKINSFYTDKIKGVDLKGVPALLYCEGDQVKILHGPKSVLEELTSDK